MTLGEFRKYTETYPDDMLMVIKDIVPYHCGVQLEYDKVNDKWYIELAKGETGGDVPNLHKFGLQSYTMIKPDNTSVHIETINGNLYIE